MRLEDDFRLMPEMTGLRSAKVDPNQAAESARPGGAILFDRRDPLAWYQV